MNVPASMRSGIIVCSTPVSRSTPSMVILGVPAIVLAVASESMALIVLAVLALVLVLVFMGLINSTLSSIYTAAVYQYAVTGEPSGYFRADLVQNAFRHK